MCGSNTGIVMWFGEGREGEQHLLLSLSIVVTPSEVFIFQHLVEIRQTNEQPTHIHRLQMINDIFHKPTTVQSVRQDDNCLTVLFEMKCLLFLHPREFVDDALPHLLC